MLHSSSGYSRCISPNNLILTLQPVKYHVFDFRSSQASVGAVTAKNYRHLIEQRKEESNAKRCKPSCKQEDGLKKEGIPG
jgi:hypothetical protein